MFADGLRQIPRASYPHLETPSGRWSEPARQCDGESLYARGDLQGHTTDRGRPLWLGRVQQQGEGLWPMSRQPSIIYEACLRFDQLKAIGVSRHEAKRDVQADAARRGETVSLVALSTGRIHADKTLETYKGLGLRYVHWARDTRGVRRIAALDAAADHLVPLYLEQRRDAGASAYTLATLRAALRMFHRPAYPADEREARVRTLGATVTLPRRRRVDITRSRGAVAMDREIALGRYRRIVDFCEVTGVRRRELEALVVEDVREDAGGPVILVRNGKGGKRRVVPVVPGREGCVARVVVGRAPGERLFPHVPARIDVHSYRRRYAQDLYREGDRRVLPAPDGQLRPGSVDRERALYVGRALGHERVDVVVRHYLR